MDDSRNVAHGDGGFGCGSVRSTAPERGCGGWMRRVSGTGVAGLVLVLAASAAEGSAPGAAEVPMTLEQAVRAALTSNRSLISAGLTRDEQRDTLRLAADRYRPAGSIGAAHEIGRDGTARSELTVGPSLRVPTGGEFRVGFVKRTSAGDGDGYRLGFSQPLLRGFGTVVDTAPLRKARMIDLINVGLYRDQIAGVIDAVVRGYRSVIRAERGLEVMRDSLSRAREQLDINRALVESGRMAEREMVRSEAEIANRELGVIESENALERASAALADVLDIDDGARIAPTDALEPGDAVHPDPERSLQTALAFRTDYLAATLGVEIASLDLAVARSNRLWDLDLEADMTRSAGDGRWDYRAFLRLNVPLLDRSRRLDLVRARNSVRRAELDLAETRQAVGREVRQAVYEVALGLRRMDLAGRARRLAEENRGVEQTKLGLGLTSTFQFSLVEDALVNAQIAEADAVLSYLDALTTLDQTLGTTATRWGVEVEPVP